jgi:hypothetical protein
MSSDLYVNKVLRWNEQYLVTPESPSVEVYWKSITAAERRTAATHCGPHGSYPLGPGCAHVSAAFTLGMSGHGKPDMACIRNYAKSHGCGVPPSQKGKEPWEPEKFNRSY